MDAPMVLDAVIVVAIVVRAVIGLRRGLLVGVLGLVGVVGGAAAGLWAGPRLIEIFPQLDANRLIRSVALIFAFLLGIAVVEAIIGAFSRSKRGGDRAKGADALFGGVVAALMVCLVSWFVLTAVRPIAPPALALGINESRVYQGIDAVVPDQFNNLPARTVDLLRTEMPKVFGGDEPVLPVPEPDTDALDNPQIQQAATSIVQILSDAPTCRTDSSGSGWVVSPQRVVTNAHVVSGADTVSIRVPGTGLVLDATVVAFDPDLDLAILAVPQLTAAPLPRASEAQAVGADAIAAGYPWGGSYTVNQVRVRGTVNEQGGNIYDEPGITREVYAFRGVVRPGNSGGPLLTPDGRVAGTVFAMSMIDPNTGYALTDAASAALLDAAASLSEPVPTGACVSR